MIADLDNEPLRVVAASADHALHGVVAEALDAARFALELTAVDDLAGTLAVARSSACDCVLFDCQLTDEPRRLLAQLRGGEPDLPILVFAPRHDSGLAETLLASGAMGIIDRDTLDGALLPYRVRQAVWLARVERAAAEGRNLLERTTKVHKDTLSIVSHDLRGPLNSIGIAAEMLAEPGLADDERSHYSAAISRAVRRADRLIRDLLDAHASEGGTLEVRPEPVGALALLQRGRAQRELEAERAGIELTIASCPDTQVMADAARVQQVLDNLIANALRHTPEGGAVTLSARDDGNQVYFSVVDTGSGIGAEALPRIFDRFYQVREKGRGTAGLGLAIARGIVRAHRGDIGVDSQPGQGATFWFTLPVATPSGV